MVLTFPRTVLVWLAAALIVSACESVNLATQTGVGQGPARTDAQGAPQQEVRSGILEELLGGGGAGDPLGRERPLSELLAPQLFFDQFRIAILLPLSGPDGALGRDMLDAAQLALFQLAGEDFVLLPRDTRGTSEGAAAAANSAIVSGAQLIIGPLFATSAAAAAPQARSRGINMITFSNTRAVAGDGVFVMGFVPQAQVNRLVEFAGAQGLRRFAVAAPSTEFGVEMVQELARATQRAGVALTQVAYYDEDAGTLEQVVKDLAQFDVRRRALEEQRTMLKERGDSVSLAALRRLEGRDTIGDVDFDAILLPAAGDALMQVAPLLPYFDIDPARVRLLGTWQWEVEGIGAEPALIGAWFAAPPRQARADFVAQFTEAYGRKPARLATLAYDATALAAVMAQQSTGGRAQTFSSAALTSPNGFAGIDGIFRFLPSGEVERGFSILEIQRRGFRVVDPAPESFQFLTN